MGALTIKPYSFTYRPWEMERKVLPNVFCFFPEMVAIQLKNQAILRILPSQNNELLTNTLRFSFTRLKTLLSCETPNGSKSTQFGIFENLSAALFKMIVKMQAAVSSVVSNFCNVGAFLRFFWSAFRIDFDVYQRFVLTSVVNDSARLLFYESTLAGFVLKGRVGGAFFGNVFSSEFSNFVTFCVLSEHKAKYSLLLPYSLRTVWPDLFVKLKSQQPYATLFYAGKTAQTVYATLKHMCEYQVSLGLHTKPYSFVRTFLFLLNPFCFRFSETGTLDVSDVRLLSPLELNQLWLEGGGTHWLFEIPKANTTVYTHKIGSILSTNVLFNAFGLVFAYPFNILKPTHNTE